MSSAAAMLNRLREPYHHDEFLAFTADPALRAVLIGCAKTHAWPDFTVHEGGVSAAIQFLVTEPPPRRLVVDLGESPDPVTAVQMLRDTCAAETVILVLGAVNDVRLYRDVLRAGAADYIVKPVTKEAIEDALERALKNQEQGSEAKPGEAKLGRFIVFIGAKGGIGASTLATNCAWLLANEHRAKTVLVDFDLQFGTMALNLDLEPSHGLSEVLANASRIDGLFLTSAMVSAGENLTVLASEEPLEREVQINAEAAGLLLNQLRVSCAFVVADLPRSFLSVSKETLAKATDVVVVSDLSLPSVRDTLRLLAFLKETAPTAKVSVLANRVSGGKGQISRGEFERGIEAKIAYIVPDDPKSAAAASNAGKPLPVVAKNSAGVKALRKLARGLAGPGAAKPKRSLFSWLKR